MNFEFMTIDTPLPPCMPFPRALTGFPVSSTAKVMYCRMLDAMLSKGQEDENGILFVCFPVTAIAAVLSRSPMTVKRSLNELETAGLIMRVRQGVGEPNRIYVLIPGKEDAALASDCNLSGKVKSDVAVLEVDERSSQFIYTKFVPDYILCTNLFRDSIMRNGHSGFIFDKINDYLDEKTTLVLNANDGISGLLGENKCNRVFFSVNKTERSTDTCEDTVCDLIACPKCNHKLDYEFFHYNHIGVPKCSACGFEMPQSTYFASDVDFENGTFVFNGDKGESIVLPYQKGNFFNVFNITGACAICRLMGIDIDVIADSIEDLSSKTGRFQENKFGGVEVVSMLSKNQNPISCSQSLKYLDSTENDKDVVLLITDSNVNVLDFITCEWGKISIIKP